MIDKGKLEQDIIAKLKTVYDPEIPVDIWELGLVYEIKIDDEGNTYIKMTLTSPACPVAGSLPPEVKEKHDFFFWLFSRSDPLSWCSRSSISSW